MRGGAGGGGFSAVMNGGIVEEDVYSNMNGLRSEGQSERKGGFVR